VPAQSIWARSASRAASTPSTFAQLPPTPDGTLHRRLRESRNLQGIVLFCCSSSQAAATTFNVWAPLLLAASGHGDYGHSPRPLLYPLMRCSEERIDSRLGLPNGPCMDLATQNHADAAGRWPRALIESAVPLWTPGRWCGGFSSGRAVEAAGSSRWAVVSVIPGSAGEPVTLCSANGLGASQRGDPSEVEIRPNHRPEVVERDPHRSTLDQTIGDRSTYFFFFKTIGTVSYRDKGQSQRILDALGIP
jgi:hypothetical protein